MTETTGYVEVSGARLGYARRHSATSAAPLVFVHGYAMRSTGPLYRDLFEDLARDFDVYALDLRGHGNSNGPDGGAWSLAANADDVAHFVDRLGLQGAVFAGHSIGGFTGMLAEIRHPGLFSTLCLLATAPASGGRHNPQGIAELFVHGGRDQKVMHDTLGSMYLRPDPENLRLAVEACGVIDPGVHRAFFPEFQAASIEDRLCEIQSAVLLVNGARDTVIPPEEQHRTALGLRRFKEVILSQEGHMLPLEAAAACAREVSTFVRFDTPDLLSA